MDNTFVEFTGEHIKQQLKNHIRDMLGNYQGNLFTDKTKNKLESDIRELVSPYISDSFIIDITQDASESTIIRVKISKV